MARPWETARPGGAAGYAGPDILNIAGGDHGGLGHGDLVGAIGLAEEWKAAEIEIEEIARDDLFERGGAGSLETPFAWQGGHLARLGQTRGSGP